MPLASVPITSSFYSRGPLVTEVVSTQGTLCWQMTQLKCHLGYREPLLLKPVTASQRIKEG